MSPSYSIGLLILFLANPIVDGAYKQNNKEALNLHETFSLWPSTHNAVKVMRIRRQEPSQSNVNTEGGAIIIDKSKESNVSVTPPENTVNSNTTNNTIVQPEHAKVNVSSIPVVVPSMNINSPGVAKRASLVFGAFALMGVAYYVFFRWKTNKNAASTTGLNEAHQFRYGVLNSDDQRENMDLSRVPLTMDSDEDDDLEIFDMGQKKKSLSYVNLQTNDVDLTLPGNDFRSSTEDILLDIDEHSNSLINWSSGDGNKSVT